MIALTREVSPALGRCELTHLDRHPIDVELAIAQHRVYEAALCELGCKVERLPALADNPDSVFVEDTAVVLPEIAVVTRPGAAARRSETDSVAQALHQYREVAFAESPATIDGGDVLVIGSTIYVGESTRTNAEGIRQLARLTSRHGYHIEPVTVSGCLHLKSAVTRVGDDTVLLNPQWIDPALFESYQTIEIDPSELHAANAVSIGASLIYPTGFDRTAERLASSGFTIRAVDVSELQKAEGAVTCCSILFTA